MLWSDINKGFSLFSLFLAWTRETDPVFKEMKVGRRRIFWAVRPLINGYSIGELINTGSGTGLWPSSNKTLTESIVFLLW